MSDSPVQRALAAATAALFVACGCLYFFLPPMVADTVDSVLRVVLLGTTLATALLLHTVFVAIAARRLNRSVIGWAALAFLLFPIGSVASLILLNWFGDEAKGSAPAARA